jgi:hypothetical protein
VKASNRTRRAKQGLSKPSTKPLPGGLVWFERVRFVFDNGDLFEVNIAEDQLVRLQNRLWRNPQPKGFALLDTKDCEVALNIDRLSYWTILRDESGLAKPYDPGVEHEIRGDEEDHESPVMVITANHGEPIYLWPKPDNEDDDERSVHDALIALDTVQESDETFVRIVDQEFEEHYFRTENILVFSADYWIIPTKFDIGA